MRLHIRRVEEYHGDPEQDDLDVFADELATQSVCVDLDTYRARLAVIVGDNLDRWLGGYTFDDVTVAVSQSEFEAYRRSIGVPLPIPGQRDIFGDEIADPTGGPS